MKRVVVVLGVLAVAGFVCGQTVERVSVSSTGEEGNGTSQRTRISDDGRYVVFESAATNLVPGDTDGAWDIFVHDLLTGATDCASVDGSGAALTGSCRGPHISGNGRYVSYTCHNPDDDAQYRAHIYDMQTGDVEVIGSFTGGSTRAAGSLDYEGRYFLYSRGVLVCGMGWCEWHYMTFLLDRQTQADEVMDGGQSITADGTHVVLELGEFWSLYNIQTGEIVDYGHGDGVSIDDAMALAAFDTYAQLDPQDTDNQRDVYLKDLQTGGVTLLTPQSEFWSASGTSISPDGRYVSYSARAESPGPADVYRYDCATGETVKVTSSPWSGSAYNGCWGGELCSDPDVVLFESDDAHLVIGDSNGCDDLFVCYLDGPQPVGLTDDWNLIGYLRPYHEPTLLADCEIDDGSTVMSWDDAVGVGLVQAMLYCYEEGVGYTSLATSGADDDSFRSGCGYWLLNESGAELILRIPW